MCCGGGSYSYAPQSPQAATSQLGNGQVARAYLVQLPGEQPREVSSEYEAMTLTSAKGGSYKPVE